MADKDQIIQDIANHIGNESYSKWYIGITSDPRKRLFNDHNVDEKNGAWIYKDAESENTARAIEKHFLELSTDGGEGGGDGSSRYVYAYRKTSTTNEDN